MTHDELLEQIDNYISSECDCASCQFINGPYKALRAVVELHKPDKEGLCAMNCVEVDDDGCAWTQVIYPCPTIQAIEKELL
jgi:hypothetical protein